MKWIRDVRLVGASFLLCFSGSAVQAQMSSETRWSVDLVKVKPGQLPSYLKSLELNWAAARVVAKELGAVKSYKALVLGPLKQGEDVPADIILLTEYASAADYENREEIFAPILARKGKIKVEDKVPRDFVESMLGYSASSPLSER